MGRFLLKWRKDDGTIEVEGYERMADLVKRMKYFTAYNKYFQVIHDIEPMS